MHPQASPSWTNVDSKVPINAWAAYICNARLIIAPPPNILHFNDPKPISNNAGIIARNGG
jgi:hypothetical protein